MLSKQFVKEINSSSLRTVFQSLSKTSSQRFLHTTPVRWNKDIRAKFSEDHYKEAQQDKVRAVQTPYKTVYKYDNRATCLGLTTVFTFPGIFWSYQFFNLLNTSTVSAPLVTFLGVGVALTCGSLYYMRNHFLRVYVTKLEVAGPEDPVILTRSGFFGQPVKRVVPRKTLRGIRLNVTPQSLATVKTLPFSVAGFDKYFRLHKDGLFDTSGELNSVVGYDVTTFERCRPSPLTIDEERAYIELDKEYMKTFNKRG